MRIDAIHMSWFRGAAERVELDCSLRSLVVYGPNGSGKSSFVDAVEYAIRGKIDHLSHEYSGSRQERAIPNTHTPEGRSTAFTIRFKGGDECAVAIASNGTHKRTGTVDMADWEYRRTVLRQDEVSRFIHSRKGDKYSDLLPLLGLEELDIAAENLQQLARAIEKQSKLKEKLGIKSQVDSKRRSVFKDASDDEIDAKIADLHNLYCQPSAETDLKTQCVKIVDALTDRINAMSRENLRYLTLRAIAEADLADAVTTVRDLNGKLAGSVEPLITEKLQVLESAHAYSARLSGEDKIDCPACGQQIGKDEFKAHVRSEQERLQEINETFQARRNAISTLIDVLKSLRSNISKAEVENWRTAVSSGPLKQQFAELQAFDPESLRQTVDESILIAIEANFLPIIDCADQASQEAPPEVTTLLSDKSIAEAANAALEARSLAAEINKLENLIAFVHTIEENVRKEIRERSEAAISDISDDIQRMWEILHPNDPIDSVQLYLPSSDKAIDISLRFHGKDQNSPRLTLSEGYRNSLGLCIFLALAKREASNDRPLILDDVVVSFDRNHRGMIVDVLETFFSERQVIILTHDRDWYTELRHRLDNRTWNFRRLLPFLTPEIGIRWSERISSLDDARGLLEDRPDAAGNDARKTMDTELAMIAEKLRLRMPYLRGDKNDHRMCHEFLERIRADGKRCFQKKVEKEYVVHHDALGRLEAAHRLLESWGNRSSHSFDAVEREAENLINACEQALGAFICGSCNKLVTFANVESSKLVQCSCGELRWRYDKG